MAAQAAPEDREVRLTAVMADLVVLVVILVRGVMAATVVQQMVVIVLVGVMAASAALPMAVRVVLPLAATAALPMAGTATKAAQVEMLMVEMAVKADPHQQQQLAPSWAMSEVLAELVVLAVKAVRP